MTENLTPETETASNAFHTDAPEPEEKYQGLDLGGISDELKVRSFTPSDDERGRVWEASDYSPIVTGSGAIKLASSAVAPLVVAARGYESVQEEQAKDFAKNWTIGDGRSKKGSQFLQSFRDDGDVLVMPWHSVGSIAKTVQDILSKPFPTSLQIRPQNPRTNDAGKAVKYEFLIGDDTVLDYHPACTSSWVNSASRVMITEGLLKGDSSLTAQLLEVATRDELRLAEGDDDRLTAIYRLNALMERIEPQDRVAVISLAGVGNWRNNPEWTTVNLKERPVLIAFDGDVISNWNVWNMAKQLFDFVEQKKKAQPILVNIERSSYIAALAETDAKMGLDDFFADVGRWSDVEEMLMPELPERPAKSDDDIEGMWRVTGDGTAVEARMLKNEALQWVHKVGIGGRIKNFETIRSATSAEMAGAPFGTGAVETNYPSNVCIELAWYDDHTGLKQTAEVTGPDAILNYQPREWARHGAVVPRSVLSHREWPITRAGEDWMSAIKVHERENQKHLTTWSTMGWVPVAGEDTQAFIIGNQVIAGTDLAAESTRPGVDESMLSSADKFGVHDVYTGPEFTDPTGKYNLADDIRSVLDHYVDHGPWFTKQIAATVLAAALRPAVPLPTNVTCYYAGAPQKGKSWTAEQQMSFWQPKPDGWDALPGSASDTFASTENAISKTPIWVADDLAPGTDRNQVAAQENAIGNLIRSVHNGINKRRMNVDMTAKATPPPMSLFILTAENEHPIASIRQRVVTIEFTGLNNGFKENADKLAKLTTTASRVTAAVIRMFIVEGERKGWANMVQELKGDHASAIDNARTILTRGKDKISESTATRPAGIAGDLSLGLLGLEMLCREIDLEDIADSLTWDDGALSCLVAEQVKLGNQGREKETPGQILISCVRMLLASGQGHIQNLDSPGEPPVSDDTNAARINSTLGWRMIGADIRPQGPTIGWYTWVKPAGETEAVEVIILSRDDAFNVAKRSYPTLIQHGASQLTSWKNAWDLKLIHPSYLEKRPAAGVIKQFRATSGSGSRGRVDGIPISMNVLFGGSNTATDDDE
jgi:hypothetical protein